MKKLLIALGLICGLGFVSNPVVSNVVYADEIVEEETPTEEEGEVVEDDNIDNPDSDSTTDSVITDNDDTQIDNWVDSEITEKINEFMELDITKTLISFLLDAGFITSIILMAVKLNGEKKNREQLEKTLSNVIKQKINEEFKVFDNNQKEILSQFTNKVITDVDLLKVAVALAQDKSNESKLELLKLITSSTLTNDDKKKIENVEENIKEEKKKVDEIKVKLEKEYKEIF